MKLIRHVAVPLASAMLLSAAAMPASAVEPSADVNVAQGKPYTVAVPYPDTLWSVYEANWADTGGTELTDGRFATATDLKPLTGFIRGDKRVVTVDLGAEQTVRSARASFYQDKSQGIYFPESVTFHLSDDGKHWTRLGTADRAVHPSVPGALFEKYEVSGFSYIARYLKVEIPTDVWVFIDEIEAFGQPGIASDAKRPVPTPERPQHALGFPKASKANGKAHQQVLVTGGYWAADPSIVHWTEAAFKPYVTYVDTAGKSQDFLFDSFQFCTIGKAASGREYGPNGSPSNKVDWEYLLNQFFDPEIMVSALDRTVATARDELGDKQYRGKVVLTIPFPSPLQSDFGDVDGDGVTENLNYQQVGVEASVANRVKVARWWIEEALSRWEAANPQNLDLVGFYWSGESVRVQLSPGEEQTMRATNDYIHELGYKANWIPYVQAEGFRHWQELGFDQVNMQPNYAFQNVSIDRLQQNANMAKLYGMGIEMELDNRILWDNATGVAARSKFIDYLDYGWKTGYMDAFTNWYQQVRTLQYASQSTFPEARRMYDLTYQWMKGTYQPINLPAGTEQD